MELSWLAVIVAAVVKFVIGAVWYAPPVLGKRWQTLASMTQEQVQSGLVPAMIVQIIGDLVMAYILARLVLHYGVPGLGGGVLIGFMAWLGFLAPVFIGSIFYERRAPELVAINLGYLLVGLVVMGGIIGMWQ